MNKYRILEKYNYYYDDKCMTLYHLENIYTGLRFSIEKIELEYYNIS
ncbi:TPA: hypothetical protein ACMWK4_002688 [Clostridioides difficile]|nr:hypothetical protein [Clostridioides difficile]MBY1048324.1 hypothetical protein [Clostridioides difficile]SJU79133.1 Uncharacterised protein [Clostridioides difficile]HBF6436143.1 hypothetical protein [Clostridioides difficile]HBF9115951.1 hypothetical protein [Clostridioides difficile]HBG2198630.1 hypothetical protein [Clostridioides difficile]